MTTAVLVDRNNKKTSDEKDIQAFPLFINTLDKKKYLTLIFSIICGQLEGGNSAPTTIEMSS